MDDFWVTDSDVENIARVCHEANRTYCSSIGDHSQVYWKEAPEWQKESARKGVRLHLFGDHDAEASHVAWRKEKQFEGWVYGPVKDPVAKTHPCMVDFKDLPIEQQIKDHIFRSIVHAFATLIRNPQEG